MIIYWSMILWVPLIYVVYSTFNKDKVDLRDATIEEIIQNRIPIAYAIIIFGYFIFWVSIRKYVADTSQYISSFNNISADFSEAWGKINWSGSKGPLFEAIEVVFKCYISDDVTWFLTFIAIVSGVAVMLTLKKYSVDFFYSSFLFMTLLTFSWMMNGMRQFICVSLLFLCCDWIKDGKWIKFFIMVFILSYIHKTCLMMIPVYFIARAVPWKEKTIIFVIGIVFIAIFAEPFFKGVDYALSGTAYAGQTKQFAEDDGVNPLRPLFFAIPPLLAFIKRKELESFYDSYPILPICINMSIITVGLYFVGIFTSGILIGRLPIYCEIYDLILVPFLLRISYRKKESFLRPVFTVLVLLFFYFLWGESSYHSDLTGFVK